MDKPTTMMLAIANLFLALGLVSTMSQPQEVNLNDFCLAYHKAGTGEVHAVNEINWANDKYPAVIVVCDKEN